MYASHLAIIVPVGDLTAQNENALRGAVWGRVTTFLLSRLGKGFTRFEPATGAWRQKVDRPFGVVIGKTDPALFLYLYTAAKAKQEEAIHFHMKHFLDGIEPICKTKDESMAVYTVNVTGEHDEVAHHMFWHMAMINGELQPDCGLYYLAEREAFASDALCEKVLRHVERYALCLVTLSIEEGGGTHAGD